MLYYASPLVIALSFLFPSINISCIQSECVWGFKGRMCMNIFCYMHTPCVFTQLQQLQQRYQKRHCLDWESPNGREMEIANWQSKVPRQYVPLKILSLELVHIPLERKNKLLVMLRSNRWRIAYLALYITTKIQYKLNETVSGGWLGRCPHLLCLVLSPREAKVTSSQKLKHQSPYYYCTKQC